MIAKKNPKADLERKRFAFFQIGLLIAGSLCLAAFEYSTTKVEDKHFTVSEEIAVLEPELVPTLPDEPFKQPKKQRVVTLAVDSVIVVDKIKPQGETKIVTDPNKNIVFDDGDLIGDEDYGQFKLVAPDTIYNVPDTEAEFIGNMSEFIRDNIKLPSEIYEQGTIYVNFVVNRDGSIEQVKVLRGISKQLDNAAKKVVKRMPKWKPAEMAGKPVRSRFTVPIKIMTSN